jgi:hypothetical protein
MAISGVCEPAASIGGSNGVMWRNCQPASLIYSGNDEEAAMQRLKATSGSWRRPVVPIGIVASAPSAFANENTASQ